MIFIHNRLPSAVFLIFKITIQVPVYVNVTVIYFRVTLSGSLRKCLMFFDQTPKWSKKLYLGLWWFLCLCVYCVMYHINVTLVLMVCIWRHGGHVGDTTQRNMLLIPLLDPAEVGDRHCPLHPERLIANQEYL